ncbi:MULTISPECIES: hypothetical protein [Bacillus]|uniref:hypothetical protein n=1 Tax=Bacillus TaxID=1386 RepID=UPI0002EC0D95|nr:MULTISPECIES: hypothetical protein [Bacillus]MRB19274.1 hypothetical protein [Bacillus thuringiensis]MDA1609797.1 hypothetical protein [Bacillus cereus]MDA2041806.1 hypothetical protein [Bacillus cereus]MDA2469761.1 hypothetical protein [Bacillus cereus]MDX9639622.1 hypothetical protein [Bacillus sp. PBL-C9]
MTSIIAFLIPGFVKKFISAIIKIYQRNSDYISDFQNISTYRQKLTTFEEAIPNEILE